MIAIPEVVHIKKYVGPYINIGRPSIFGNIFTHLARPTLAEIQVVDRHTAIISHLKWVISGEGCTKSPEPVRKAIRRGDLWSNGRNLLPLACWCAPLSCHGHGLHLIRNPENLEQAIQDAATWLQKLENLIR